MTIHEMSFGKTVDNAPVSLFTLNNSNGMEAQITNFGGAVVSLTAPDRSGRFADVVLGFDTLDGYLGKHPFFGVVVGRFANRIVNARFNLDGVEYALSKNRGGHHIHGGLEGFDKKVWQSRTSQRDGSPCLELSYFSRDGEEGYPGNLSVSVFYSLTNDNALKIEYVATADKDTVLNLTNHSYFNLAGSGTGDILGHVLMIDADRYTRYNEEQLVTGEIGVVFGTALDFTHPQPIGLRIGEECDLLRMANGYDLNYVLNGGGRTLAKIAESYEPTSGRVMQVLTTEPGIQLYTGNKLDGTVVGKGGRPYGKHSGFCLECQHFPNSPNAPQFPSTVLRPSGRYVQTSLYRFSIK
jgi:aldose 1-epimerase